MSAPCDTQESTPPSGSVAEFYQSSGRDRFLQSRHIAGSFGASLMRVDQDPIDQQAPAMNEIVFCRLETDGREVFIDLGDGPTATSHTAGTFTVYPARTISQ